MILVDDQAGSKDLFPYIKSLTPDAVMSRIDPPFGDIAWWGNGPNGSSVSVGVEYKQIDDALDCMVSGRFTGHQALGMIENYNRRYLLVEGRIRVDRTNGNLQKLRGDRWQDIVRGGRVVKDLDLEHWFTTIEEFGQFRVKLTYDEYQSARWVVAKHSWWVYKTWDEHDAFKQFYVPPPPAALFQKPSLLRRVVKELPGVGWDKSLAVEARFPNVRAMACANEKDWQEVDGIGKTISTRIVRAVTGQTTNGGENV